MLRKPEAAPGAATPDEAGPSFTRGTTLARQRLSVKLNCRFNWGIGQFYL